MSTITLTLGPSSWGFEQILNDDVFTAVSGAVQVAGRTGNRWRFVLLYQNLVEARRKTTTAQAIGLAGRRNRLQVPMSVLKYVRGGLGGGTPLLSSSQLAGVSSLPIDGATANVTGWLAAGDWISIGNQLCMVTLLTSTNASGVANIPIWPELHKNYADNSAVNITTPSGMFMLENPISVHITPSAFTDRWLLEEISMSLEQDVLA